MQPRPTADNGKEPTHERQLQIIRHINSIRYDHLMRYAKLFTALVAVITLHACKKSDSKTDNPSGSSLSALETKVVGKWQLVSSVDSNTAFNPAVITDATRDCEKDDIYTFSSDKTYTVDDGINTCIYPMSGGIWKVDVDSLFQVDIVHTLSPAYPVLIAIDEQKMMLRSRYYSGPTSGSVYTTNTYQKSN